MIKRIIIKDGKKYIVNVPSWDDNPPKTEPPLVNESDVKNIPLIPLKPEPNPQ